MSPETTKVSVRADMLTRVLLIAQQALTAAESEAWNAGRDIPAADVAAIDDALTDIFLRIHTMRRRWPRESAAAEARLAMLAMEDIHDALTGASRKVARLRRCLKW